MNILGLDYGQKRIGLAWVQTGLDLILPYGIVVNDATAINQLAELVRSEHIDRIVVGLPIGMDGGENDNTKRIRSFADDLRNATNSDVVLYDERFSSQQADAMGGDASRDEKSAMVIVESYIKRNT